jgi:hypothetical protein
VIVVQHDILQDHYQLGQFVKAYGWHKPSYRRFLRVCLFLLPLTLIGTLLLLGLPLLIFCIVGISISWSRLRSSRKVVYLYEHGLVDSRKSKPTIIRYENIQNLWFMIRLDVAPFVAARHEEYKLKTNDGQTHYFRESIDGIGEIGSFLQEKVCAVQLPEAMTQLNQGDSLPFGGLTLSAQGMRWRKRVLPWAELEKVETQTLGTDKRKDVYLVLLQTGGNPEGWVVMPRDRIPNLLLLLTLIQHFKDNP